MSVFTFYIAFIICLEFWKNNFYVCGNENLNTNHDVSDVLVDFINPDISALRNHNKVLFYGWFPYQAKEEPSRVSFGRRIFLKFHNINAAANFSSVEFILHVKTLPFIINPNIYLNVLNTTQGRVRRVIPYMRIPTPECKIVIFNIARVLKEFIQYHPKDDFQLEIVFEVLTNEIQDSHFNISDFLHIKEKNKRPLIMIYYYEDSSMTFGHYFSHLLRTGSTKRPKRTTSNQQVQNQQQQISNCGLPPPPPPPTTTSTTTETIQNSETTELPETTTSIPEINDISGNNSDSDNLHLRCALKPFLLNLNMLGRSDILFPSYIDINYCGGYCPSPLLDSQYNYSLHASWIDRFRILNDVEYTYMLPTIHCVPVTYKPVSILISVDAEDSFEMTIVDNLVVDSCGCR